jgi:CelD/BcsL family acetyltransferase involved in cellulose biosynthesis
MTDPQSKVIADVDELRSHEAEWRQIAEQRGNAFVTPEWFWAWLVHYGESAEPAVVLVSGDDGSPLGLVPFVAATTGWPRTLRFAGGALADQLHPVCLPEHEQTVAGATAYALSASSMKWGVAVLDNVDVDAQWWRALGARGPFVGPGHTLRDTALPAIALSHDGWDGYLASRSRNFRDQARRYPRRLERDHRVSYRRTSDESELERDMATLFELHDARWSTRGGSTLTSTRARAFHLDFARAALRRGWLRLWILEVDGAPVAAWHGWRLGERYAYYQAGFDPAWEHLSVGFVLMVHTVRSAIEEGASRYDLLLGDESYKGRFANAEQKVCTAMLSRSRPVRLLSAAEALGWRASRSAPPKLQSAVSAMAAVLPGARRR